MNPVLGHISCPHCTNQNATVHKEKKGKVQALYYRCENCGTIQCRYPGGQAFINANARWVKPDDMEAREAAGAAAAAEAKAEVAEVAHKKAAEKPAPPPAPIEQPKKRGFLEAMAAAMDKEII